MAKNSGDKSLKSIIKEQVEELQAENEKSFAPDDEFIVDGNNNGKIGLLRPNRAPKSQDEIVIDELIASVPRGQGYYLKLYKEKSPNEFELKQRIDNYDAWSDMEWEVTSIVRQHTSKNQQSAAKWGTGRYRIVIWRDGGLRGPKYKPIDFFVDAQEPEHWGIGTNLPNGSHIDVDEKVKSQVATLGELVKTLQSVNPSISPEQTQKLVAESFQNGITAKIGETNSLSTVLAAILPALISKPQPTPSEPKIDIAQLLTAVGTLIKQSDNHKSNDQSLMIPAPTDPIDYLIKLKNAGIIPGQSEIAKTDDMEKTLSLVSRIVELSTALSGGNGNSSPVAELIRVIGPQVGKMVSDVTETVNKVVDAKTNQVPRSSKTNQVSQSPQSNQLPLPLNNVEPPMLPIFAAIKNAAEKQDVTFYDQLEDLLRKIMTEEQLGELYEGTLDPRKVLEQVATYGGPFFVSPVAELYFNNFISAMKTKRANEIIGSCPSCKTEFIFDTKEELIADPNCPQCKIPLITEINVEKH